MIELKNTFSSSITN